MTYELGLRFFMVVLVMPILRSMSTSSELLSLLRILLEHEAICA